MKGEHSAPNGTVSVRMHKRKRLTLVVPRDELDEAIVSQIESLQRENAILRRGLSIARAQLRDHGIKPKGPADPEGGPDVYDPS